MASFPTFRICALLLLFPAFAWAQRIPLVINKGERLTNQRSVSLVIDYENVLEAKFWNGLDSAMGEAAPWQAYTSTLAWELPEGDGKKVISVVFRNQLKQETEHFIAAITLDQTAPVVDSVQFGTSGVTDRSIGNAVIVYSSDTDIASIMVANTATFNHAEWQDYVPQFKWTVRGEDGEKEVFIKLKDRVGNVSEVYKASIMFDTTPPSEVAIVPKHAKGVESPDGKLFISDPEKTVDLVIMAKDAAEMMLSNDISFYGAKWEPYQDVFKGWKLREGPDGKHWIYARFRDAVGNVSRTAKAIVVTDTQKPVVLLLQINKGAENTLSEEVTLGVHAKGGSLMKISNHGDFTGVPLVPYASFIPWKLEAGEGPKSVYVVVIDSAMNESDPLEAGIILDQTPPKPLTLVLDGGAKSTRATQISVETTAEGARQMQYTLNAEFAGARWMAYSESPFDILLEGVKGTQIVYMRFMDETGNISAVIQDSIVAEVVPLLEDAFIDSRAMYCIHPEGEVTLTLRAAKADEMMISNHPLFRKGEWQPYRHTATWKLEGEDGEKTVYVKVRSSTKTESDTLSATIIFDRTKPKDCQVTINKGENRTREHEVTLELKAQDAKYMAISETPVMKNTEWRNYDFEPLEYSFNVTPGWKHIYAQFKDDKGNISEVVADSILLELVPSNGQISLNDGEDFCIDKAGQVTIIIESKNATEMMFGNSPDFSESVWLPYAKKHVWAMESALDGAKTVYAKFRSITGTESEMPVSDGIMLDRNPPSECKFSLSATKAGDPLPAQYISVGAQANEAATMQISHLHDFAGNIRSWMRYTDEPFLFRISPLEGKRTFYMRFKDEAGNISPIVSQIILVDREMPNSVYFAAADTQYSVKDPGVMLALEANGIANMRLNSSAILEDVEWIPFRERVSWHLGDEDGFHQVFLQVQDSAGNISRPMGLRFKLDRKPPTEPKIDIAEDYCNTQARLVSLTLSCQGANRMMLSLSRDFADGVWEKIKPKTKWRLANEDRRQTVYVKFADEAGNESPVVSDEVVLDRRPPEGSVTINNGDDYTDNWEATLEIDASGAAEMIVSGDSRFIKASGWQPYATDFNWQLEGGIDGKKRIYIKFRDEAMNESLTFSDSIILDTREPLVKKFVIDGGNSAVKGSKVMLTSVVEGAKYMMVSNDPELVGADWQPFFPEKDWALANGEGTKEVFVKFKDEHGHETRVFSAKITSYEKMYHIGR